MATGSIKKTNSYTTGANGIWKYRKYDDGTFHLWYEGQVNLDLGTAFAGGFFHKTVSALDSTLPSWVATVTSMTGAANGAALAVFCGRDANLYTYWWNSLAAAVQNLAVRLDVYGTW